eukprot:3815630-Pleurochrysis_carterae.AAC.1
MTLTTFKEGRMLVARVVGVLVGEHTHGLGGMALNCAHFVDTEIFCEQPTPKQSTRQLSTRPTKTDRKGYKTLRCGEVVQSTQAETLGMPAIVLGVIVAGVNKSHARRFIVLCEGNLGDKLTFFVSSCSSWNRMPPDDVAESESFDPDADDAVISEAKPEFALKKMSCNTTCYTRDACKTKRHLVAIFGAVGR